MKFITVMAALAVVLGPASTNGPQNPGKNWSIKADYIEACSCSLFCSCYFNTQPEGGEMCEFNNAIRISEGHVGKVDVSGRKVWLSGDLGGDFTKGMKTGVITFEPGTPKSQKTAIEFLMGKIYPVKWANFYEDEAPITWQRNGMNGVARLGNMAEVRLAGVKDTSGKQTVIRNLPYWGAQTNTGFYLAKGTHHYKGHGLDYNYKDRNGFFIHVESSGKGKA